MDDLSLSALLRSHRRISLLTQEQLAEAAGLSVRSVRNLESGAVRSPRTSSLHRIACALRLDDAAYRQLADIALSGRTNGQGADHEPAGPSAAGPRIVALEPGANLIVVVNTSRATDVHGEHDHPVADHDGTQLIMLSLSLPTDVR
jgi:transcriptional regulator with XRE-family HTH domain